MVGKGLMQNALIWIHTFEVLYAMFCSWYFFFLINLSKLLGIYWVITHMLTSQNWPHSCIKSTGSWCVVPQKSGRSPLLFLSYTVPVGNVVNRYCLKHHVNADDKDIYIAFKPKQDDISRVVQITENCFTERRTWFAQNFLQLNDDKAIFMLISSRYKPLPDILYIQDGEVEITPSATATNLGVTFYHQ